jgi:hypothetical protein
MLGSVLLSVPDYRKSSEGEEMRIAKLLFATLSAGMFCSAVAGEKIAIDVQGNRETVAKLGTLTSVKKDNFEKTTEFTKRLCEQTYKTLGTSEKTPITIGLEHGQYATSTRYNADKQAFAIRVAVGGNHFRAGDTYNDHFRWHTNFDPYKYEGIRIAEEYREAPSTYSGKNAFGASKDVKIGAETAAVLYFPSKNRHSHEIVFPSKPEEARRIEKDLRVAIITRVQSPCFVSGQGHKPPTMDYAYDLALSEVGIVGASNPEWVLYLDSTKEIMKRGKFR